MAAPVTSPISWFPGVLVNVPPLRLMIPLKFELIPARYEYCAASPPLPTSALVPIPVAYVRSGLLMSPRTSVP
jgi:hypothetical protein